MLNDQVYSISELNKFIKDVISSGLPQSVWVCGEIQNFYIKRHVYFSLIEKEEDETKPKSEIKAIIWANRYSQIQKTLSSSENKLELKNDLEIKALCKVDYYVPKGSVSLQIEEIDPTYTLGRIAQEKQKLIALLKKKGVLDKNKEIELPLVPLNIGLITSDNSAAYNDFVSELKKSELAFNVFIRNTLVSGKNAEIDTVNALEELEHIKDLDLIVITRGGGSIADLSCFDSEVIAIRIAKSQLPVLSGIGHEINITITDLAAHTYQKTPTAIAQFLVDTVVRFLEQINEYGATVVDLANARINSKKQSLKDLSIDMQNTTQQYLKHHEEKLLSLREALKHKPPAILKEQSGILKNQRDLLVRAVNARFQNEVLKLKGHQKMISAVHPVNTLKRGFSITRTKEGKVVRKISDVKPKEELTTAVIDGVVLSQVSETKKEATSGRKQIQQVH